MVLFAMGNLGAAFVSGGDLRNSLGVEGPCVVLSNLGGFAALGGLAAFGIYGGWL